MSRNEDIPSSRFVSGLLAGIGLGSLAYLLYKTEKGKEFKKNFTDTIEMILDELDKEDIKKNKNNPVKKVKRNSTLNRARNFFHRKGKKIK